MDVYCNVLKNSSCLIPANALSGLFLSQIDDLRMQYVGVGSHSGLSSRIEAIFIKVIVIPLLSCAAVPMILFFDFPIRILYSLSWDATAQNKVHLIALAIFLGTIWVRIGCYWAGKRDLLFPVDYKKKGFFSELDPILKLVKNKTLKDSFVQKKLSSRRASEYYMQPEMTPQEMLYYKVVSQEGGVQLLRQLHFGIHNRELDQDEFDALIDALIQSEKFELLGQALHLKNEMSSRDSLFAIMRVAVKRKDKELVNQVMAAGCDVNIGSGSGDETYPLQAAIKMACKNSETARNEYLDFALFLIDEKGAWRSGSSSAFDIALGYRNVEVGRALFERRHRIGLRLDLWSELNSPKPRIDVLEYFLKVGMDPNQKVQIHGTPLIYALSLGHTLIAKLLLRYRADPNDRDGLGRIPLEVALENNQIDLLEDLADHGANLDVYFGGDTALIRSVRMGKSNWVRMLIQKGANRKLLCMGGNHKGKTALEIAHALRNEEVVHLLSDGKEKLKPEKKESSSGGFFGRNFKPFGAGGIFGEEDRKERPRLGVFEAFPKDLHTRVISESLWVNKVLSSIRKGVQANDPWALFGTTQKEATKPKLEKAYKKLSLNLHPDKNSECGPEVQKWCGEVFNGVTAVLHYLKELV